MLQFSKEAGHRVEETKLRVVYVDPPRPPSPVHEGSEEGSSPRASVSDNGNNASDFTAVTIHLSFNIQENRTLLAMLGASFSNNPAHFLVCIYLGSKI